MQIKLLGITYVDFNVMDQQLMKFSISGRYWTKNGGIMVQCIRYSEIPRGPIIQLGGKYYTIISLSLEYPGN
jgi:hypothetical protein